MGKGKVWVVNMNEVRLLLVIIMGMQLATMGLITENVLTMVVGAVIIVLAGLRILWQ